jgi:hypothetical protein
MGEVAVQRFKSFGEWKSETDECLGFNCYISCLIDHIING